MTVMMQKMMQNKQRRQRFVGNQSLYVVRRGALAVVVAGSLGFVAACSSLPRDTGPQALRPFEDSANPDDDMNIGPTDGQEPDLLLRDFYRASASPDGDYRAAKRYLTDNAKSNWQPHHDDMLIVDRIEFNTASGPSDSAKRKFNVRGTVIGKLGDGGKYLPEDGLYETSVEMELVDNQWRISSLPSGVVIERNELRNQYQPQSLYFFDSTGSVLVSDRRWLYSQQESLGASLATMLVAGPSSRLAPATKDYVPEDATFLGIDEGTYKFSGMSSMSTEQRMQFAAQLVWTLATASVPGPYSVLIDDVPVRDGLETLSTDDFAGLNPKASSDGVSPLYALANGSLVRVASDQRVPLDDAAGELTDVSAADIGVDGTVAVVRSRGAGTAQSAGGGESQLFVGELDGTLEEALSSEFITRPTLERGGGAVWVATQDKQVVRVVRSTTSGELSTDKVDTSALEEIDGEISVLRLSNSGATAAMIIDGHVYTGVVQHTTTGERKIVNVHEMATEIGGTALSLDWQPDGSLLVGTSAADTPVWRVEQDGSAVSSLPSGNVTAPVVAVAASGSTLYITDAHATLQLPASGSETSFWREVPGLQGQRSVPAVAN
ncbi:MtrAB system accessory lipoprotein LpqB [Corynebacterium propinquum]|uniref:Lipoprotein LpqB n=2 Tax=Corynebacterium propinquum TaxID=43769 RepID=A0AAP4FAM3_9CORY|nr:MtrAB system accessory lipoprotein LpqB [Corynebacterium propinquum]MDK4326873.1 MtrAB system accessory lipoprotein LpqB [Corynebacterium propinquum]